jgi:hypothetical protein
MYRYLIVLYVLLLATFYTGHSVAVEVENLYQASVPAISQTNSERKRALQQAMEAVIVKVGGQPALLSDNVIKKAIKNVNQYLANYRYERINNINRLNVTFDEQKINALFSEAKAPLWGSLRPQVLLWLVQEDGLERTIISSSSTDSLVVANPDLTPSLSSIPLIINEYSQQRGLPIIMPLMDLTDIGSVSSVDVWGRFSKPVQQASVRYMADAIVMVRLSNSSLLPIEGGDEVGGGCAPLCDQKHYALDWSYIGDAKNLDGYQAPLIGEIQYSDDPQDLLQKALASITHNIYQQYAIVSVNSNTYTIDVANIDSLKAFINVEHFLQDLAVVKSVQLIQASGRNHRFQLNLVGTKLSLLASLKLNQQLIQQIDPLADIVADAVPIFYWKP